jgi:translation initiation factor 2 subunit 1
MQHEQKHIPAVGELVIAQISKIMPFGAYCKLLEYEDVDVFLPIKEVSSGWIKNIHEFIHEGQKVVCKVIFYDVNRQSIDVSIKKVTPQDSKQKINTYNLEKRLNALLLQAVRTSGLDQQKNEIVASTLSEFGSYTNLVRAAAEASAEFENSKLPKKLKDTLSKLIETSRKKRKYFVSYVMKLSTFNTKTGATELREILAAIKSKGVEVQYVSAPKYHLSAEGKDYADAESKIRAATELVNSKLKKGEFEVEKEKVKKEKGDIMSTL